MLTFNEINILGEILDTSWGRSSTEQSGSPQWAVVCKMLNDERMSITYKTIVNLGHPQEMACRMKDLEAAGVKIVQQNITRIKKEFEEAAGRKLKLTMKDHSTDVEYISMSAYSPVRTAYFRLAAIADMG